MAYTDLREFITELEKRNLLVRIKKPVDPELEISEITTRVSRTQREKGKALLFENVKGSVMPVVTNLFGSTERMKLALQTERFESIGENFLKILKMEMPTGIFGKIHALSELKNIVSYFPKTVKSSACKEVVLRGDEVNLNKIPVLKLWPKDGGRFITLPMVFTKNPETGMKNCGMYRMQIYDEKTTGMHWHAHKNAAEHYQKADELNKKLEAAVVIGSDPASMYSATAPLPPDTDEMIFSGFLRKKSVELVKCETVDLEVPANSEIVLEGYINPGEEKMEGPFGDHTGYYSEQGMYPVFHVTCITHRKNPIYAATVTGIPPMEDAYMGKATERIFLPFIKLILPEIHDINLPVEGVFHNLCIVSINKKYPGHARKVMLALWGLGQMMFTKVIIVVDNGVDVQNVEEVLWAVTNRIDPKRDTMFIENAPMDVLEHATDLPLIGSKMGIDATNKWKSEGFLRERMDFVEMDEGVKKKVDEEWKELNLD